MQIHRVRGNDLKDALQRARRNYGQGALVISQEQTADGGVTLAVAQRPLAPGEVQESEAKAQPEKPTKAPVDIKVYDEVRKRLGLTGFTEEWMDQELRRAAASDPGGVHPMDHFGEVLGRQFQIARLKRTPGVTRVVSFVGNTGVGKTTGLAKLGARLVRGQLLVGLATLDSRRVGAVEQARAYAEMLGAPMRVLKSDQALTAEAVGAAGQDVVLLDTSGRPENDCPQLRGLHRALGEGGSQAELDTFLVLPASASRSALREVTEAYSDLRLSGCVITKTDETRQCAAVLEHVLELGLPVAFISDGQDLGLSFKRATPELLADLALLGRIG